jgi:hypothetical protein
MSLGNDTRIFSLTGTAVDRCPAWSQPGQVAGPRPEQETGPVRSWYCPRRGSWRRSPASTAGYIVGHEVARISSVYRAQTSGDLLPAAADHVHVWIFPGTLARSAAGGRHPRQHGADVGDGLRRGQHHRLGGAPDVVAGPGCQGRCSGKLNLRSNHDRLLHHHLRGGADDRPAGAAVHHRQLVDAHARQRFFWGRPCSAGRRAQFSMSRAIPGWSGAVSLLTWTWMAPRGGAQ